MATAIVQCAELTILSSPNHQGPPQQGHCHRIRPKLLKGSIGYQNGSNL